MSLTIVELEERNQKLTQAIQALVNLYVANKGTKHEFISCITPRHASELTPKARAADQTWNAWDTARELIGSKIYKPFVEQNEFLICAQCSSLASFETGPRCKHDRAEFQAIPLIIYEALKVLEEGCPEGWTPAFMPPKHGGRVQIAYVLGVSANNIQGPFVDVSRYDCDKWEIHKDKPLITVIAWRPLDKFEVSIDV